RGIVAPAGGAMSRKEIDTLAGTAKAAGAGGLIWCRRTDSGWEGQGTKALGAAMLQRMSGAEGEMLLAVAGPDAMTSAALNAIRLALGRRPETVRSTEHAFCWVVDFPLFERDPESGQQVPAHHPFTAPHPEDTIRLRSAPAECRAQHYDAVYNGTELGSGSIRITDTVVQRQI